MSDQLKKMPGITATVQTGEQFDAVLESRAADTVYIDAGCFGPEGFAELSQKAESRGIRCGLRLPQIWRARVSDYMGRHLDEIRSAGFGIFLCGNVEGLLWICRNGLAGHGARYALDHSVYIWNSESVRMLRELLAIGCLAWDPEYITLPLELSLRELGDIDTCKTERELTVYGRAPMMVTAQCLKKTASGCDMKTETLMLKDRTKALMPVRNCCAFCMNTIYNSVPTAIYDMREELGRLSPERIRYEFTDESRKAVLMILEGCMPPEGAYTRGHARKSVL